MTASVNKWTELTMDFLLCFLIFAGGLPRVQDFSRIEVDALPSVTARADKIQMDRLEP